MDTVVQLKSALAGRYDVEREIGAGGMATVYLARDIKHDRRVAIKVLRPELGAVLGVERFLSEIKVTANLQHPNLLPLFDSGEASGLLFYVMPFVEGESLRAKLTRERQLPIDEAIHIATAVASALEYAHSHGVIHRDLKPENILLQAGEPVVADFGIALAVTKAGGERVTQTGLSLGTPQYMSPEQATGDRAIDGRTDVYSLGAMLYEMLTGDPPFTGSTAQAIIAKTLTERATLVSVRRDIVPEYIDAAVDKALTKLPADRWSSARQFSEALTAGGSAAFRASTATGHIRTARTSATRGAGRSPLTIGLAAALVVALAALAWSLTQRNSSPLSLGTASFEITLRGGLRVGQQTGVSFAFAPDGRSIVYVASRALKFQLYRRTLDDLESKPITGTEDGLRPSISPDSKSVAFYAGGQVRRIPIEGGAATPIADGNLEWGMTWLTNDEIVLANTATWAGLSRVGVAGGTPTPLTTPDTIKGEAHVWPVALDDGENIIYTVWTSAGLPAARLAMVSASSGKTYPLDVQGTNPLGVFDGKLVYTRADGALMAVPFDVGGHKTTGAAISISENVIVEGNGVARIAASRTGWLAHVAGGSVATVAMVDEHGNARTILSDPKAYEFARLSPDGRRIAVSVSSSQGTDVWMYDIASGTFEKFTSGGANRVEWTPDSKRILFRSARAGRTAIWWQPADQSAEPQKLLELRAGAVDEALVTPDSKYLVYRTISGRSRRDVFYVPLDSLNAHHPLLTGPSDEYMPRVSPDMKWVAYVSDESTTPEVYVRPFPGATSRVQVSTGGGTEPMWSSDGRTLFYRTEKEMVAVTYTAMPAFAIAGRKPLFEGNYALGTIHQGYDVSRDGKQFLMLPRLDNGTQMIVVANWLEVMRRKFQPQQTGQ